MTACPLAHSRSDLHKGYPADMAIISSKELMMCRPWLLLSERFDEELSTSASKRRKKTQIENTGRMLNRPLCRYSSLD